MKPVEAPPVHLPSKPDGKPVDVGSVISHAPKGNDPEGEPRKPKVEKPVPCKHETLTVACGHEGERAFSLHLPERSRDEDGESAGTVLEVIDNGREKITCTTKILAGPCAGHHSRKVFD